MVFNISQVFLNFQSRVVLVYKLTYEISTFQSNTDSKADEWKSAA